MNVLIDTSIWSLAFRKKKTSVDEGKIIKKLEELITDNRVAIIGPIRQEILSGIQSDSTFKTVNEKLEAFEDIPIFTEDYIRAAQMFNICRRNGIQGTHVDFIICAAAEKNHCSIYTLDKDFIHYARVLPIIAYK